MSKEAMKLALGALIGDRAFLESDAPVEIWGVNDKAITALREALADQSNLKQVIELYDSPDQPAQRTWVGLTDEEDMELWKRISHLPYNIVRHAIEAKLRSKNGY